MQRKRELIQRTREVNVSATEDTGEHVRDGASAVGVHSTQSTSYAAAALGVDQESLQDRNTTEQV